MAGKRDKPEEIVTKLRQVRAGEERLTVAILAVALLLLLFALYSWIT